MVVFIGGGNDDKGGGSGGEGVNGDCGCGGRGGNDCGGGNNDNRNGGDCWMSKFRRSLYYVQHIFIQNVAFGLDATRWLERNRE